MDPNTMTAATALFLAVAAVFGAAAVLLSAPVATLLRRAGRARRSDSRIHAGGESQ
ncbi:MAG: hypothetical protein J0I98_16015 [Mesorhizobium sp.]|nr:hypothetical protein [Mesorhizobium sp.]MBN9244292.1 hypothetical protein [Mesorhizobium sp.]